MSKWSRIDDGTKISQESAEESVRELLEHYQINVDDIDDKNSHSAFESVLNKLVAVYRRGQLENKSEDGRLKIVQHLVSGQDVTYDELQGKHKPAMDGLPADSGYKRQYALLGSLSGIGANAIEQLRGPDLSVAECLGFLFLMA